MPEIENEEMIRRYSSGETVREIAEVAGISDACVYHRLRNAGVSTRRRGKLLRSIATIIDMYESSGISASRIAMRFKVSVPTILKILHDAGVPIQSRRSDVIVTPKRTKWEWNGRESELGG